MELKLKFVRLERKNDDDIKSYYNMNVCVFFVGNARRQVTY